MNKEVKINYRRSSDNIIGDIFIEGWNSQPIRIMLNRKDDPVVVLDDWLIKETKKFNALKQKIAEFQMSLRDNNIL